MNTLLGSFAPHTVKPRMRPGVTVYGPHSVPLWTCTWFGQTVFGFNMDDAYKAWWDLAERARIAEFARARYPHIRPPA